MALSGEKKPVIYMDCGTEDESLYQANTAFKDLLLELGYQVVWDSRPGGHDSAFWNDSLRKAVEFLPVEKLELKAGSPMAARLEKRTEAMTRKMTLLKRA